MKKRKVNNFKPFEETELPTGDYYGALPEKIIIKSDHWVVVKTGVVDGETIDKIKNFNTNQTKVLKRDTLIKFLQK